MAKANETATATATATLETKSSPFAALFSKPTEVQLDSSKRLNMPVMMKQKDFPVGAILQGEIVKVVDSTVTTVKGKLLWLRLADGTEITFQCTGDVRSALAPDAGAEDKPALQKALEKHVGKMLTLKRGVDNGNTRSNYSFEVFIADKPKSK